MLPGAQHTASQERPLLLLLRLAWTLELLLRPKESPFVLWANRFQRPLTGEKAEVGYPTFKGLSGFGSGRDVHQKSSKEHEGIGCSSKMPLGMPALQGSCKACISAHPGPLHSLESLTGSSPIEGPSSSGVYVLAWAGGPSEQASLS